MVDSTSVDASPASGAVDDTRVGNDANTDISDALRGAILAGDFAPGQRLIESDLCADYATSRFVVRAALQALSADGLVEFQRNKGARVRVVPLEEALEIVEVRAALEGISAARAASRRSASDAAELRTIIKNMRKAVDQGDVVTYGELNVALHAAIQRISANATCSKMLGRLQGQIVRHQFALSLQPGRPNVSLPQHERIVSAIVNRDEAGAERAMREHLGSVIEAMSTLQGQRSR